MARLVFTFAIALFAASAPVSAQTFNAQEQAEIRAIVRDYLVRNPDVLREALDALADRNNAERWQRMKSDPRDFSLGPANAPIVIVEFFDYRCPACHAAMTWLTDVARTRNDVRVVFKEFPILSDASWEAARASIAAMPQGRYWAFHRALMSFTGDLTSERIDQLARQSGIDVPRMRRAMDGPEVTRMLEDTRALAVDAGANATPLFVINGQQIPGFDAARLDARLREAAREARQQRR